MYSSGFLKNTNTGGLVRFKAIDPSLFSVNFAKVDDALIFSIIDTESDSYSTDKVRKDIYFNDGGRAMFIYDMGMDVGGQLGNLLPYEGELEDDDESAIIEGELIIVHFGENNNLAGKSLYESVKSITVEIYKDDINLLFMRHTLSDQKLLVKDVTSAEIVLSTADEKDVQQYSLFVTSDNETEASLVDKLYRYREISEGLKGDKIDDYINLNFKVKSISTSSVCNIENLFIQGWRKPPKRVVF